jgi:hypothetical protein
MPMDLRNGLINTSDRRRLPTINPYYASKFQTVVSLEGIITPGFTDNVQFLHHASNEKKRRLEEDISKIPEPSLSETSEHSTTTVNPQSDIQHEGDTNPPEASTADSQKAFQKDFKHDENTDTTETDTGAVKESMVNLEEVKKDERNDDPEQQNPSEDDDSDEDYTGDCFDGWEAAWGSDRS